MSIDDTDASVNLPELGAALAALRIEADGVRLAGDPQRLGGGFWAQMWIIPLAGAHPLPPTVVLRVAPDAVMAAREAAVQRLVHQAGFPTPEILADDVSGSTVRPWSVMAFAAGSPLLAGLDGRRALVHLPRLWSLPQALAWCMNRLHRVDATPVADLEGMESIETLLRHQHAAATSLGDRQVADLVDRLQHHPPPLRHLVVCHGDLHPFNILDDDGDLTVIDWTAARVAPAAYDVAFTSLLLEHPPLVAPGPLRPIIGRAARSLAHRFRSMYLAGCDRPDDVEADLTWHTGVHTARILLDVDRWRAQGINPRGHPWLLIEQDLRRSLAAPGPRQDP